MFELLCSLAGSILATETTQIIAEEQLKQTKMYKFLSHAKTEDQLHFVQKSKWFVC